MRLSNTRRERIAVLAVAAVLLLTLVSPAAAITWGEPDSDHTNVGAIVVRWDGQLVQVCSGTLTHQYVFLTAGHCTAFLNPPAPGITEIYVNFDQNALNEATLRPVMAAITHPNYGGPRSNPHDVGVLILEDPVTDITPAELPDEGLLDELNKAGDLRQGKEETDFVVVGYGGTLHWPPSPPDPKITYENQRQVAESEYQSLLKAWLLMSQNQATGDGGTCFGDSGGPAFWIDPESGQEILVGLTSWGDAQCVATGMDYRVDIPDSLDFIYGAIDDVDATLTELAKDWLESED